MSKLTINKIEVCQNFIQYRPHYLFVCEYLINLFIHMYHFEDAWNLYNKYSPGGSGIGATSRSVLRAKNRLATVCNITQPCNQIYNRLGLDYINK